MPDLPFIGPTKGRLLDHLRAGPKTAGELARSLGIQVSAARKHLERLRVLHVVREEFVHADRGRPRKLYALTESGAELFPRRYDAVLNGVLTHLVSEGGEEDARRIVGRVAEDLAREHAVPGGRQRLQQALVLLDKLGFDVGLEKRDGQTVITSRNCPILRTAKAHREIVCMGLHAELIRRSSLAKGVRREKWMVDGDNVCTHILET